MEFDEDDPIRYDRWIEDALRGVIRQALSYTAENGLVGDHHFYITFRTDTGAIELPDYLRAQHPNEMTIVLQHQYEHLSVDDDRFFVTLRFNGQAVNLNIPLEEITGFTDPSVNFGLQLKTTDLDEEDMEDYDYPFEPPAEEQDRDGAVPAAKPIALATVGSEKQEAPGDDSASDGTGGGSETSDSDSETGTGADNDLVDSNNRDDTPQTGEVIALDAFRKK